MFLSSFSSTFCVFPLTCSSAAINYTKGTLTRNRRGMVRLIFLIWIQMYDIIFAHYNGELEVMCYICI